MESSLFSIVVINFNYERYLRAAIDSALAQTYPAVEVIVVDDCSTDGSRAVIESYGARVVACMQTRNAGMSASANAGFRRSSGSRVLFLDADDVLHPDALEVFASRWDEGVAQGQSRLELIDGDRPSGSVYPPYETPFGGPDVRADLLRRGRYQTSVTSGLAFARDALDKVMPIPEQAFDRSADGYLATVVPLYGTVISIDRPLGGYRRHTANHSGFQADIARRARWRIAHDEHRYDALRVHAARNGLDVARSPGLKDPQHLEERLASLCFDPEAHPYVQDARLELGLQGIKASFALDQKLKRKLVGALIFAGVGLAPHSVARRILSWKMERSSRPAFIDALSGWLRRRLG